MSNQACAHTAHCATKAKNAKAIGNVGENKACVWLESMGFRILARNYCTQFGEIDIIALRADVLHFIEVKSFSPSSLSPRYAITPKKLAKIYASIDTLLFSCRNRQANQSPKQYDQNTNTIAQALQSLHIDPQGCPYCVDALLIWGDSIELLENISLE